MKYEILIAGFGGQGVLFTGKVMAYAGLKDGREVSWMPSYGPEMRGGTTNCSVVISDEPIGSPIVTEPDILIAMNTPSLDKFVGAVVPGGKVFLDSSVVQADIKRDDIEVYAVPATQMTAEHELRSLGNLILLGKVYAETQFSTEQSLEAAIKACVPARNAHLIEPNLRAIRLCRE